MFVASNGIEARPWCTISERRLYRWIRGTARTYFKGGCRRRVLSAELLNFTGILRQWLREAARDYSATVAALARGNQAGVREVVVERRRWERDGAAAQALLRCLERAQSEAR